MTDILPEDPHDVRPYVNLYTSKDGRNSLLGKISRVVMECVFSTFLGIHLLMTAGESPFALGLPQLKTFCVRQAFWSAILYKMHTVPAVTFYKMVFSKFPIGLGICYIAAQVLPPLIMILNGEPSQICAVVKSSFMRVDSEIWTILLHFMYGVIVSTGLITRIIGKVDQHARVYNSIGVGVLAYGPNIGIYLSLNLGAGPHFNCSQLDWVLGASVASTVLDVLLAGYLNNPTFTHMIRVFTREVVELGQTPEVQQLAMFVPPKSP